MATSPRHAESSSSRVSRRGSYGREFHIDRRSEALSALADERAARDPVYVRQILFAYTNGKLLKGKPPMETSRTLNGLESTMVSLNYPDFGGQIISIRRELLLPMSPFYPRPESTYDFEGRPCAPGHAFLRGRVMASSARWTTYSSSNAPVVREPEASTSQGDLAELPPYQQQDPLSDPDLFAATFASLQRAPHPRRQSSPDSGAQDTYAERAHRLAAGDSTALFYSSSRSSGATSTRASSSTYLPGLLAPLSSSSPPNDESSGSGSGGMVFGSLPNDLRAAVSTVARSLSRSQATTRASLVSDIYRNESRTSTIHASTSGSRPIPSSPPENTSEIDLGTLSSSLPSVASATLRHVATSSSPTANANPAMPPVPAYAPPAMAVRAPPPSTTMTHSNARSRSSSLSASLSLLSTYHTSFLIDDSVRLSLPSSQARTPDPALALLTQLIPLVSAHDPRGSSVHFLHSRVRRCRTDNGEDNDEEGGLRTEADVRALFTKVAGATGQQENDAEEEEEAPSFLGLALEDILLEYLERLDLEKEKEMRERAAAGAEADGSVAPAEGVLAPAVAFAATASESVSSSALAEAAATSGSGEAKPAVSIQDQVAMGRSRSSTTQSVSAGWRHFKLRPLNLIVLTRSMPEDDLESVLVAAARRLDRGSFPLSQIGVMFLQLDVRDS